MRNPSAGFHQDLGGKIRRKELEEKPPSSSLGQCSYFLPLMPMTGHFSIDFEALLAKHVTVLKPPTPPAQRTFTCGSSILVVRLTRDCLRRQTLLSLLSQIYHVKKMSMRKWKCYVSFSGEAVSCTASVIIQTIKCYVSRPPFPFKAFMTHCFLHSCANIMTRKRDISTWCTKNKTAVI